MYTILCLVSHKHCGLFLGSSAIQDQLLLLLLLLLQIHIGVQDSALNWFDSYLTPMCNYRTCTLWPHQPVTWSAIGLSLGLFGILCVYTSNRCHHQIPSTQLSHLCRWHTSLLSFDINELHNTLAKLNACLFDIWSWIITNTL